MSMQGTIGRAGGDEMKRALGIQALLEWAFRTEQARLEPPHQRMQSRKVLALVSNISCCNAQRWAAWWTVANSI